MLKTFFALVTASGVALTMTLATPALAQTAPSASQAKPANPDEVNTYSWMGSVSVCILNQAQVELDKSLPAATEMMTGVILAKHGGAIQGTNNDQKMTNEMIFNGSLINIVYRVKDGCYSKLSPAGKKQIDEILSQVEKLSKGQAPAAPIKPSSSTPTPSSKP